MKFIGFKSEALDFLIENRINDSKAFYEQNKYKYVEFVKKPFYELIDKMAPKMLEIDERFMINHAKMLSRVRRDTRFSKDKTLYRDNAWIVFVRDKNNWSSMPSIYFEISPSGFGYGMGYYKTPNDTLETMRHMILSEDEMFLSAFNSVNQNKKFELYGQEYKRPKHPEAKSEYQKWLNKKTMGICYMSQEFDKLFSGSFYDEMIRDLKKIKPFYDFMRTAEERKLIRGE